MIDYQRPAQARWTPHSGWGVSSCVTAGVCGVPLSILVVAFAIAPLADLPLGLNFLIAPLGCSGVLACPFGVAFGVLGVRQQDARKALAYVGIVANALPLLLLGGLVFHYMVKIANA
jgi:hypothetical protein